MLQILTTLALTALFIRALSHQRSIKTLQSLAAIYYNTDRPQEAAKLYKEAYDADPSSLDIQVQYVSSVPSVESQKGTINIQRC